MATANRGNFYEHLDRFGDQFAVLLSDGSIVSYSQLHNCVQEFRRRLPATRVLGCLLCRNNLAVLVAYLACLQSGLPVILLPDGMYGQLLQKLLEVYRPSFLIKADGTVELYDRLVQNSDDNFSCGAMHAELAIMLSTSGSTGSPKQVMLSYRNLQSNAGAIVEYLGLDASDKAITTLPFHYSYGLSVVNSHLSVGATLILNNDSVISRAFWQLFDATRPTSMAGVPHTYEMLQKLRFHQRDLGSLRYMTQAGGKLCADVVTWFAKVLGQKQIRFFVMYGQTEATARMAYLGPGDVAAHADSIGRPIPGGSFELHDPDGKLLTEPGERGELIYRGANVMLGYARSRQDLLALNPPEYLATGDLAYADNDGRFYVCGRKDRTIKVFGHRIDLDEFQGWLQTQGWPVICAGETDRVVIAVIQKEQNADVQVLLKHLADRLPFSMKAVSVILLPEEPKTDNGKIAYGELLRLVA